MQLRPLTLALLLALALPVAACGGDDGSATGGDASGAEAGTRLEVTLWPAGSAADDAVSATLGCDPPAGDLPDPAAACAALADDAVRAAFEPVPEGALCTMLYGGPEEARIEGVLDGAPVAVDLNRGNGCEIERWDALAALLPDYERVAP